MHLPTKLTTFGVLSFIVLGLVACQTTKEKSNILLKKITPETSHITFANTITEGPSINAFFYEYSYNGGGVAVGDVNNDGLDDLYFTGNMVDNQLYVNQGNFQFKNITKQANAQGDKGWSTGTTMVDINNDGWLDIYICQSGPLPPQQRKNLLLVNQGTNKQGIPIFKEEAEKYGLASQDFSMQAAFFDYDKDGDLDMYLMNHNGHTLSKEQLAKGSSYYAEIGDKLFKREGKKYVDVTKEAGIYSNAISYGLGLGIADVNNDNWPDIYVSNDYEEYDYLYINQQNGHFKEVVKQATNHISNFSMGNDLADIDNDGFIDAVALDMVAEDNYGIKTSMPGMSVEKFNQSVAAGRHHQYMYNTLQRNSTYIDSLGIPHFSEIGHLAGISNSDWSWAPLLVDFDNDGWKDLFITNGIKRDFRNKDFIHQLKDYLKANPDALLNEQKLMALIRKTPSRPKTNYIFKNQGNLQFIKSNQTWLGQEAPGYSNGAAYADLDNDGDIDLVVNNVDAAASVYENRANELTPNNYLVVNFAGPAQNKLGVGCRITLFTSQGKQVYINQPTRGYLSSVPPNLHIGLGRAKVDSLRVDWPTGQTEMRTHVKSNQQLTLSYTNASPAIPNPATQALGQTSILHGLTHIENPYDDYQQQVLLPHKMSQMGPALAVADVNKDGLDDIFIGNATGYASGIYVQTSQGKFKVWQMFDDEKEFEDLDAVFFDYDKDGDLDLYVVTGGNEFAPGSPLYQDRLYVNNQGHFLFKPNLLPNVSSSGSVVRKADFNNDGWDDLFIGGRHLPHRYPEPTDSYLLIHTASGFIQAPDSVINLKNVGRVTDAVWSDVDNDNDLDLLLVGEWMAPLLFTNKNGIFIKSEAFSQKLSGWYYAIKAIDIDNDGDQDYLVGNLGANYKYQASINEPFEVYYNDFDANGSKDIVLSYYNFGKLFPLRGKDCSTQQVPALRQQLPTYDMFGSATLQQVYDEKALAKALHLQAFNFKSGILLNNGASGFSFKAFPPLAQVSSINDFSLQDVNNDGITDIVLAGNMFQSEIETPRNDAGYGLVLLRSKSGKLSPLDAGKSGLFVPWDVKTIQELVLAGKKQVIFGINNKEIQAYKWNKTGK